ncbi:MAG: hypothetical protein WBB45_21095 [Cyclobacteriaceae bacterium]
MDELKQAWLDLNSADYIDHELKNEEIMQAIHSSSKSPIRQLAINIYAKFWFAVFFIVLEIAGIILIGIPIVKILLGIMLGAYVTGGIALYMEYKDLKKGVTMDMNLLSGLRQYRDRVRKVLKYEERAGIAIYPVAIVAGLYVGAAAGNPDAILFSDTRSIIILGAVIVVLVPACYYLARWMNKVSFGKLLDELDENIQRLENA